MHVYNYVIHAVAVFSLNNSTYFGNEQNDGIEVCVVLEGRINRNISLLLGFIGQNDTASLTDLNNISSLTYTFEAGPEISRLLCNSIPTNRDGIVEGEETFLVDLQENPDEQDVMIDRNQALVFIADSPEDSESITPQVETWSTQA